ncbi:beta-propeller fold lactonase family protein [Leptospira brenneri]|uniref:Lactonase n=1 Tax=Leptospira brenneri TaxID=2023182 RepID=A0A5F1ZCA1_9LEPT|nr:beta-propeller fold lactonase family protein [Leptospira brenneri]TGK96513.1 hypothetical protein EHQ30_07910 [Leptospira brenneri]
MRIYSVDAEYGPSSDAYVERMAPFSYAGFPGNAPARLLVPPKSRKIIFAPGDNGSLVSLEYTDSKAIEIRNTFLYGNLPSPYVQRIASTPTDVFYTLNTSSNTLQRWSLNSETGALALKNSGNYPFGVACSPLSLRYDRKNESIAVLTGYAGTRGISFLKSQGDSLIPISPNFDFGTLTSNDNLCIHPERNFFYSTISTFPNTIKAFQYSMDGAITEVSGSPFAPDTTASGLATGLQMTTNMVIDPDGKYLAIAYVAGSNRYLSLLAINRETGALSETGSKYSVGNSPSNLHWDKSGQFIYLTSDTGGSTNNYQLEYFKVMSDGSITRGVNSPITINPMSPAIGIANIESINPNFYLRYAP